MFENERGMEKNVINLFISGDWERSRRKKNKAGLKVEELVRFQEVSKCFGLGAQWTSMETKKNLLPKITHVPRRCLFFFV